MTDTAYEGLSWNQSGSTTGPATVVTYAWGDASTSTFTSGAVHFTDAITGAYQTLVQQAMHAWEAVANVSFKLQASTSGADIDLGWEDYGSGSQLGETDYGAMSNRAGGATFIPGVFVGFEDPAYRNVGSDQTSTYSGFDTTLYQIVLHELGHALGLAHSDNPSALMYPNLGPNDRGISQYDATGVQTLYGRAQPPIPTTPTLVGAVNGESNRSDPTLEGTGTAGDTVTVTETTTGVTRAVGSAVADAQGHWTVQLSGVTDGSHAYAATDTDANGTASQASAALRFIVDTTPPAPAFASQGVTRDASPTITGTVEAGATVTLAEGGTTIGTAVAGPDGTWRAALGPMADGTHAITATAVDLAGNASASPSAFALLVDTVAPAAPGTPTLGTAGPLTSDMAISIDGGGAEAFGVVTLFDGNAAIGIAQVGADGTWTTSVALAAGQHALSATEADAAGNASAMSGTLSLSVNQPAPAVDPGPTIQAETVKAVYRFFDSVHGTQFLTSDPTERDGIIASRPDLAYEGKAMGSVDADPSNPNVAPVFRFFDSNNGTHFFTTSAGEKDHIVASRHDLVLEQANLFEHVNQQAGDTAVYRFFNTHDGSHFFTSSAGESASIMQNRPDMVAEGVSFYAPKI